jgi:hypothetical protein
MRAVIIVVAVLGALSFASIHARADGAWCAHHINRPHELRVYMTRPARSIFPRPTRPRRLARGLLQPREGRGWVTVNGLSPKCTLVLDGAGGELVVRRHEFLSIRSASSNE